MKTRTMRNVGGWMFFVSVVLLFLDACAFFLLFQGEGTLLPFFLEFDVFLAAICVGISGGILWTVGWIVDEFAKKAQR